MKVCYISAFYPASVSTAEDMLAAWPLLRCLPPALHAIGHDVTVLAHAARSDSRTLASVDYRFLAHGRIARAVGRALNRLRPHHGPAWYLPATGIARELQRLRPDIVHFAGLTLDLQLATVVRTCRRLQVPVVVHYHGGEPARGLSRRLQRQNLGMASRVLLTTAEQAEPWIAAGLLDPAQVAQVVETSSPFHCLERSTAREVTGMEGDPVYLSAGRLHPIKDPLTMLDGYARICAAQPGARLYLYYLSDELLPEIRTFLEHRPEVSNRVELRGRVPLEQMEAVYSSADFLLQASTREWSGLAVLEAMSCGCIPIVTDLSPFRVMTGDGVYGRLFPVGDADGLAQAALSINPTERDWLSRSVKERFDLDLSFAAMARRIDAVYRAVCGDRGSVPI